MKGQVGGEQVGRKGQLGGEQAPPGQVWVYFSSEALTQALNVTVSRQHKTHQPATEKRSWGWGAMITKVFLPLMTEHHLENVAQGPMDLSKLPWS